MSFEFSLKRTLERGKRVEVCYKNGIRRQYYVWKVKGKNEIRLTEEASDDDGMPIEEVFSEGLEGIARVNVLGTTKVIFNKTGRNY